MNVWRTVIGSIALFGVSMALGCGGTHTVPPATAEANAAPPTYQEVSFAQLVNPAFTKDYAGKYLEFDAVFMGILNLVVDLPKQYQEGFVRANLSDDKGTVTDFTILMPKDKSIDLFAFTQMQKVHVKGYASAAKVLSLSTGREEQSIMFLADSVIPRQ